MLHAVMLSTVTNVFSWMIEQCPQQKNFRAWSKPYPRGEAIRIQILFDIFVQKPLLESYVSCLTGLRYDHNVTMFIFWVAYSYTQHYNDNISLLCEWIGYIAARAWTRVTRV